MHLISFIIEKFKCSKIRLLFISYFKKLYANRITILHSKTQIYLNIHMWKHDVGAHIGYVNASSVREYMSMFEKQKNKLWKPGPNSSHASAVASEHQKHCCVSPERELIPYVAIPSPIKSLHLIWSYD